MSTELEKEIINLRADLAAERAAITSLRANAEKQGAYVEGVINDYAVALAKAEQDLAAERAAHAETGALYKGSLQTERETYAMLLTERLAIAAVTIKNRRSR